MAILDLSVDLLILIFEYLDADTKLTLYEVCETFQAILHSKYLALRDYKSQLYIKRWSRVLHHPYLSASREYLVKLDISGMKMHHKIENKNCDEFRSELKSAINILFNLEDLNIGCTDLTMPDALDICTNLPKLTRLCVNFAWPERRVVFTDDMLMTYRLAFRHIEYLHFIGGVRVLLDTDVLLYISDPDEPKELRLTFIEENNSYELDKITCTTNDISVYKKLTLENYSRHVIDFRYKLIQYTKTNFAMFKIHFEHELYEDPEICLTGDLIPYCMTRQKSDSEFILRFSDLSDPMYEAWSVINVKIVMWHKDYYSEFSFNKIKNYLTFALPMTITSENADKVKFHRGRTDTLNICNCVFSTNHISDIEKIFPETSLIEKLKITRSQFCACDSDDKPLVRFGGVFYRLTNLKYLCFYENYCLDLVMSSVIISCPNLETLIASGRVKNKQMKMDFMKDSNCLKHFYLSVYEINVNIILNGLSLCPTLETIVLKCLSAFVKKVSISNIFEKCPELNYMAIPAIPMIREDFHEGMSLDSMLSDIRKDRPNFDYRIMDCLRGVPDWHPRETVFRLNNSFAPENVY